MMLDSSTCPSSDGSEFNSILLKIVMKYCTHELTLIYFTICNNLIVAHCYSYIYVSDSTVYLTLFTLFVSTIFIYLFLFVYVFIIQPHVLVAIILLLHMNNCSINSRQKNLEAR